MDFWDGTGQCWYTDRDWQFHPAAWPNGFDLTAKAHKAGLKTSLYMGGTYKDADLSTTVGRDTELNALLQRFDAGWFDTWRTDRYTAPNDPIPDTLQGVITEILKIQDAHCPLAELSLRKLLQRRPLLKVSPVVTSKFTFAP